MAGAGAGAGAGAESETVVGSLADTMNSLGMKPKDDGGKGQTGGSPKTLNANMTNTVVNGTSVAAMNPGSEIGIGGGTLRPKFPDRNKNGTEIFITDDMRSGTGTSTDAGSESYSQVCFLFVCLFKK